MNYLNRFYKTATAARYFTLSLSAALMLTAVGCGPPANEFPTAPTKGIVTYKGAPVPTGTVMLTPVGNGPPATGNLAEDGTFVLKSYGEDDGAVIGEHGVTITALEMGSGLPEDIASEPKQLIPQQYGNANKSGLTATITEGDNMLEFHLE
ncbi:hypothetical protein FF011L_51990 [Roseimaritima multifibrata]|uniref:Carboxypeptidase regulatory-like domain-containing protein n=1 Tax=Roseimaritima multifibrata TaxID=1930274 RepID=A0A517MND1_9BACT|nr:hypothetical protein [Roseimaritima multifibrata]QDS96389.1 hypothetical protein FF011L_51990 [Roseimaritima multifibrata]